MSASPDVEVLAHALGARIDWRECSSPAVPLRECSLDSRTVAPGALYCALPGRHAHGAAFAHEAVVAGAAAILTDEVGAAQITETSVPLLVVDHPRKSTAEAASLIFGSPQRELNVWGVTGTNGKTTVTFLLDRALQAAGLRTTLIGTLGHHVDSDWHVNSRTTPESPDLYRILAQAVTAGVTDVVMEVSSIAVSEERVRGLHFAVMGFTNLSHDHLDYHGTMEAYYAAKARLFTESRSQSCSIGLDDEWGRRLASEVKIPTVTWSTQPGLGDWTVQRSPGGLTLMGPSGELDIAAAFPTRVLAANLACVAAMISARGLDPHHFLTNLTNVDIPGRMEVVSEARGVRSIVDYAHTPDAIDRVIAAVRPETHGKVICVIGAGGDRDASKRHGMGVSAAAADHVIITDDNPRSEDPQRIRAALLEGVRSCGHGVHVVEIPDRHEAIASALSHAAQGDTVLVLGKGHETGQEIMGVVYPCDDRRTIREWEHRVGEKGGEL